MELSQEEIVSVKKSYMQILKHFLSKEMVESRFITCLLKWGVYLNVDLQDIKHYETLEEESRPASVTEKAEAIYDLVRMIYLDDVVEDIELEVALIYTRQLGLEPSLVGDFFKAIATAPFDGKSSADVRAEIMDYLKLYGMID